MAINTKIEVKPHPRPDLLRAVKLILQQPKLKDKEKAAMILDLKMHQHVPEWFEIYLADRTTKDYGTPIWRYRFLPLVSKVTFDPKDLVRNTCIIKLHPIDPPFRTKEELNSELKKLADFLIATHESGLKVDAFIGESGWRVSWFDPIQQVASIQDVHANLCDGSFRMVSPDQLKNLTKTVHEGAD